MRRALSLTGAVVLTLSASESVLAKKKSEAAVVAVLPREPLKPVVAMYPIGVDPVTMPRMLPNAVLPADSEVIVRMTTELSSKVAREGDTFTAVTASDVMLANMVVIPRGTPVNGVVTWRTGKGAFGKSAKMEYSIISLALDGQSIPVQGHFRQEGIGNTGATVAGVVAIGPFAGVITGRSAVVPAGTELKVYTRMSLPVLPPVAGRAALK